MHLNWRKALDFVFPTITAHSNQERMDAEVQLNDKIAAIRSNDWSREPSVALEEALRISAYEGERKKTAESKATTYLAVTSALIPIVLTIQSSFWDDKTSSSPEWLRAFMLAIAVTYTAMSGWYAFATLNVSNFHAVGVKDMLDAWTTDNPVKYMTKTTLENTIKSQETVNNKVTLIKMTHLHLIRAFFHLSYYF
jgi:hypothetical protein